MSRRAAIALSLVAGIAALTLLLPVYDSFLPRGLSITRGTVRRIADQEARRLGIPVDRAWTLVNWRSSPILLKELGADRARWRTAQGDPVLGPRLGTFRVTYFRRSEEKRPEYGYVLVGPRGEVVGARRLLRPEEKGASLNGDELRTAASSFVRGRPFPGAPAPELESVRPYVQGARTDHVFRYRVPSSLSPGIACYLAVHFAGERLAGWELFEEYTSGVPFRSEIGSSIASEFLAFGIIFALLAVGLVRFLRKYHAGEVGIGTGALLFGAVIALSLVYDALVMPSASFGNQMGGLDAPTTAVSMIGFKFLFYDIPLAALVFMAFAVGESDARERWGEKLASFDALLRRDFRNRTVGGSLVTGVLAAPAVAAAGLLLPVLALWMGWAAPELGNVQVYGLSALGGPWAFIPMAALHAVAGSVVALMAILAWTHRRRLLPLGIAASLAVGSLLEICRPEVRPPQLALLLGFGGVAAVVAVFLSADVLASAVAIFTGSLVLNALPMAAAFEGSAARQAFVAMALPLVGLLGVGLLGLTSGREVVYLSEDLAPHVKRIVERERVKAEIDAANRIQAALLPLADPALPGAEVASHYRAATEIGGDYFDFLLMPDGRLGLAFGDVSGHGLTSGIVMAMAKAALLVQVGHDSSPARVMEVLNDIVLRTAPKRILMTFFYGLLETDSGELRFASAGHLDPYVFRAGSGRLESLSAWGFPLGVRRREPFREITAALEPGDRLILYSDGFIEAVDDNGEPFGFERFERVLTESGRKSAQEIKSALLSSVKRFTRNRPPEDDQTLVVLSYEGRSSSIVAA